MAFVSIIRFTGQVAAFAAMVVLLLQVSCAIGLTPLATAEVTPPAHSGCHESAPAPTDAPASGQKCCNGEHSPEALLTVAHVAANPVASAELIPASFESGVLLRHATEIATPAARPPRLLALRI